MKNITVTLDDETAAWARIYAAQQHKSLSRYLGEILHRTMSESREYEDAMKRYLSKKPLRLSGENVAYPIRQDIYDGDDLR